MVTTSAPKYADLVQLVLRSASVNALLQSDDDWRELGNIASRTLFWRGGAIYACRGERNEIRLAIELGHATLGSMAHHISGSYAIHLRQKHGIRGAIFEHYRTLPCDSAYLQELVFWLHQRPRDDLHRIWTTEDAYLAPGSAPWVNTERVLTLVRARSPFSAADKHLESEPLSPEALEMFARGIPREHRLDNAPSDPHHATLPHRPSITSIAQMAATFCRVPYEDMLTATRRRTVSKARVITTVLATRNGATVAAAARLFNRTRSTLIEQVEYYRANQPEIFAEAEAALEVVEQREARE
jgi:hypothetical protein